jgi:hypothetical protein
MRWSSYAVLEGEQLDEWQLYVEGRKRCYGTFAGRWDDLVCVGLTSGNCTLRDGIESMVCVGRGTAGRVAIVR